MKTSNASTAARTAPTPSASAPRPRDPWQRTRPAGAAPGVARRWKRWPPARCRAVALVACLATLTAGVLTVRQERTLQHLRGALLGLTVQLITGVSKLRVAGAEARAFAVWGRLF